MKKLKEQIIHETHKNKDFIESLVKNLQSEVGEKVDEKSFADKVKYLIEEYENED